ncbi:hypothetical protein Bra471DRAFT_01465 [Bradyrhizobium sp. WSM471]|nr:hypothetical protein Bra471DRAFT_01465 [Bradyrhizobium sp. WSM471]
MNVSNFAMEKMRPLVHPAMCGSRSVPTILGGDKGQRNVGYLAPRALGSFEVSIPEPTPLANARPSMGTPGMVKQ